MLIVFHFQNLKRDSCKRHVRETLMVHFDLTKLIFFQNGDPTKFCLGLSVITVEPVNKMSCPRQKRKKKPHEGRYKLHSSTSYRCSQGY